MSDVPEKARELDEHLKLVTAYDHYIEMNRGEPEVGPHAVMKFGEFVDERALLKDPVLRKLLRVLYRVEE